MACCTSVQYVARIAIYGECQRSVRASPQGFLPYVSLWVGIEQRREGCTSPPEIVALSQQGDMFECHLKKYWDTCLQIHTLERWKQARHVDTRVFRNIHHSFLTLCGQVIQSSPVMATWTSILDRRYCCWPRVMCRILRSQSRQV